MNGISATSVRAWCFLLGVGLWMAGAQAQADLTLESALQLAQARSRLLPAQEAAARAAREMAVAAGQLPDPLLRLSVTNLPADGPDRFSLTRDFMTMRSVGVMQELTRLDKRMARAARLEQDGGQAEAVRAVELAELRKSTAMAWLERHFMERLLALQQSQRVETALQIDAADAAFRGGRGAQADVFAARSAVALIDDDMLQTRRQIATAQTALERWVGVVADRPLGPPPGLDQLRLVEPDLAAQLEDHPLVQQWRSREALAQADSDIARSNRRSDWSVELMYSQRGPAYSNMLSLNLSTPLQWDQARRQDRELAARLAQVEQTRDERDEAVRGLVAQARAMLQTWQHNRARLVHYDSQRVPLAQHRSDAALAAYRGATGPLALVLDARRAEIDLRIERLRIEMDNARLWAQVQYMMPAQPAAGSAAEKQP